MIWQTSSTGSEDTLKLGELLGKLLSPPAVIELRSDLGGGKTTFVRGLAAGAGSKDIVSSPTFTLNKIYKLQQGKQIHHFDFYRLSEPGIIADQLAESLDNSNVVTVIEWSDIVKGVLPAHRIVIEFNPVEDNSDEREIKLMYPENLQGVVRKVETDWVETRP